MAVVGVILVAIGILIAYEAVKGGLNAPAEASGGTGAGSSNMIPSSQGIQSPGQWQQLLEGQGLPANIVQTFMGIINRESNGNASAICFAPGADASKCTSYPKAGDTQGAFGPFQFLNSTWNGLGCYPPAPSDPLAINTAAFDPGASVSCAAKAFQQVGLQPWGF